MHWLGHLRYKASGQMTLNSKSFMVSYASCKKCTVEGFHVIISPWRFAASTTCRQCANCEQHGMNKIIEHSP